MAKWGGKLSIFIGADVSEVEKKFKQVEKQIKQVSKTMNSIGGGFSVAVTAPLTALGAAAVAARKQFEEVFKTIRIGTGATGDALKGLMGDFKAIAGQVPASLGDSAKAIADINTMTGATGETLQAFSKAALDASRMMDVDLGGTISSTGKLMNNWNLRADQGVTALDKLFVASQNTGMAMTAIAEGVTRNGGAMREMGLSLDEAIALVSSLDKAGVNAQKSMQSLSRALVSMSKAGIKDTSQALKQIFDSIKGAGSLSEALRIAEKLFGIKAGSDLAIAIREGKVEVEGLVSALQSASGEIEKTAKETEGFTEKWDKLGNQFAIALEPLGTKILGIAEQYMPKLSEAVEGLSLDLSENTIKWGMFAAAIGPATLALGGFTATISSLVGSLKALYTLAMGPAGVVMALGALAAYFGNAAKEEMQLREETERTARVMKWMGDGLNSISTATLQATLRDLQNELLETQKRAVETWAAVARESTAKFTKGNGIMGGFVGSAASDIANASKEINAEKELLLDQIGKVQEELKRRASGVTEAATSQLGNAPKLDTKALLSSSSKGHKAKGKTEIEKFVEDVQARMKYMNDTGLSFIPTIEAMQAKLKPLSSDWKKLEDLRLDIDTTNFNKSLETIQDKIKYLKEDGASFLPTLQEMAAGLDPLSEKGKRVADVMKSIMDSIDEKKWGVAAWEYSEGLLKANEYAAMLQEEIKGLTVNTEKWRERFSELQNVKVTEIGDLLDDLSYQFEKGKIDATGYEVALAGLVAQFQDFPKAAKIAADALEAFQRSNETATVSLKQQLGSALKSATQDFNELQGNAITGTIEGFLRASIYGEDFGESLKKLGQDIVYTTMKMLILREVTNALSGIFGFSGGGVVSGGINPNTNWGLSLMPMAKGGIVNKPTVFPMASGMGLMGEAGAEAVMPLARDSSGRLGVIASGGEAPSVVINVENNTGTPIQAEQTGVSFDEQMRKFIVNVVLNDQGTNGPITRNLRRAMK